MKKINLITLALASLVFAACNKDNSEEFVQGRTAVRVINTQITGTSTTRATDASWQAGDVIGLVMFEAGTATPLYGKTALKYATATAEGYFQPTDEANTGYYPEGGKQTDILAFYPHTNIEADLLVPVNTTDQTALNRIDLMVADKSTGHSADNPEVSLNFRHKLAKLVITVDKEESAADIDLTGATLKVSGTVATAKWSLPDARLIVDGNPADINLVATTTKDNMSATGIVLPTDAGKGVKLLINTAAGKTFTAPLPETSPLSTGTVNILRVHLSKVGEDKTEVTIDASIADWTKGFNLDLPVTFHNSLAGSNLSQDTFVPAQNDQLALSTIGLTTNLSATYTASATGSWTSELPLNWKNFDSTSAPFAFCALITPKAGVDTDNGQVKDYLSGRTTGIAYAAIIDFASEGSKLQHAMSQVTLALTPGNGVTAAEIAAAEVSLQSIRPLTKITYDGTITLGTATAMPLTRNSEGNYNARIAPQTIAAGQTLISLKLNGKSYSYKVPTGGLTFAPGKLNKLNLTISVEAPMQVVISLDDWVDGFNIDGEFELN